MLESNEILLSTSDMNLCQAVMQESPEGVSVSPYYTRSAETEKVASFLISFASDISSGIFAAWLYDKFKNCKSTETSINGHEVTNDLNQINVVINEALSKHKQKPDNYNP